MGFDDLTTINILFIKITVEQNEVALSYHTVHGLYLLLSFSYFCGDYRHT